MEKGKNVVTPVALPVRGQAQRGPLRSFSEYVLPYFPTLRKQMVLADVKTSPEAFMDKVLMLTVVAAVVLAVLAAAIFNYASVDKIFAVPLFFVFLVGGFFYFMAYPTVMVIRRKKMIDYELVFAIRHLLIGLRAGMPLFDAMVGVSRGYGEVSKEFNKIVEKVTLGTPMSQAMREVAQSNPSSSFQRVMTQLANTIGSGADVADSLEVVLNQIFKEQVLELKAYGQKLNPLIMFYMIFGIIFPSLGLAFAIIVFSFIGSGRFEINAPVLLLFLVMVGVIQFMFLSMAETSRPRYAF
jgi:flagellar protein FlaJ